MSSAALRALIALAALVAGVSCERYERSSEEGIELARFERQKGSRDRRNVVLNYYTGTYEALQGFFLERGGELWTYGLPQFSPCAPLNDTEAKLDCLFERSVLTARIAPIQPGVHAWWRMKK